MKLYVFALLLVAAVVFALPIEDGKPLESLLAIANKNESLKAVIEEHYRERINVCKFLPIFVPFFCAAQCVTQGFITGECINGVCECRKEKFLQGLFG